jgi:hypothetical protein
MLRRASQRLYQVGAQVPHGMAYRGARMRTWPRQQLPHNLSFLPEQRWAMKPIPRDIGRVPRDFVLSVVYKAQPVNVGELWDLCTGEAGCVLDSKRHLREVLKQAREEGFLVFEKDVGANTWVCSLARERFEEVRTIVITDSANQTAAQAGLRGRAAERTTESSTAFEAMDATDKVTHVAQLRDALRASNQRVERFQRTEVDYLPFTTLNGKVDFMWWYESRDVSAEAAANAAAAAVAAALPGATDRSLGE